MFSPMISDKHVFLSVNDEVFEVFNTEDAILAVVWGVRFWGLDNPLSPSLNSGTSSTMKHCSVCVCAMSISYVFLGVIGLTFVPPKYK